MYLLKKEKGEEEGKWEQYTLELKIWLFRIMQQSIQQNIITPLIYKIIILIETLQIIGFIVNKMFLYLWTTVWINYIRQVLQYFNIIFLIQQGDETISILLLYILFFAQLIIFGIMLITNQLLKNHLTPKTSSFLNYSLKFLSLIGIFNITIFVFPYYSVAINMLYCNNQSPQHINFQTQCYQGIYFLHLIVAILSALFSLFYTMSYSLLYFDMNPSSTLPQAAAQNELNIIKIVLKVLLTIYILLDTNSTLQNEFSVIFGIFYLVIMVFRCKSSGFYNRSMFKFQLVMDSTCFWLIVCDLITLYIDIGQVDNIGLFYAVMGIPLSAVVFIRITNLRRQTFISTHSRDLRKQEEYEYFMTMMMEIIGKKDLPENQINLQGMIIYHNSRCPKPEKNTDACFCQKLIENEKGRIKRKNDHEDNADESTQKEWYMFLNSIMNEGLQKHPKSSRLHILNSFLLNQNLDNKYKSLSELILTKDYKMDYQEEFAAYCQWMQIEEELIQIDKIEQEGKNFIINDIVKFQNKLVDFSGQIENCVDFYTSFWKELLGDQLDVHKLQQLGAQITMSLEINAKVFLELISMNPNNIQCLTLYGHFLKEIVNEDSEGSQHLDKAEQVAKSAYANKQFLNKEKQKYGENSDSCIITCSCSGDQLQQLGIITNCNNEIKRILGFNKDDLVKEQYNINRIMPKPIADIHSYLIKDFIECSNSTIMGKERIILCINTINYLIPCSLMIKCYPFLDEGIQMIGLLKEENEEQMVKTSKGKEEVFAQMIAYKPKAEQPHYITNISRRINHIFGINRSNLNSYSPDDISLELFLQHELEKGKSMEEMIESMLKPTGYEIIIIDFQSYRQNFDCYKEEEYVEKKELLPEDKEDKDTREIYKNIKTMTLKFFIFNTIEKNLGKDQIQLSYRIDDLSIDVDKQSKLSHKNTNSTKIINQKEVASREVERGEDIPYEEDGAINDDLRHLKDFKTMIGEKTTSKKIKILNAIMLFLMLLIFSLALTKSILKNAFQTEIGQGLVAVQSAFKRHSIMMDINYQARQIYNIANNLLIPLDAQNEFKSIQAQISAKVDELQNVQFQIIQSKILVEDATGQKFEDLTFNISFELQNGAIKWYNNFFTDSMFQYITASSSLSNSSVESFVYQYINPNNTDQYIETTQKNFYFIRQNGLFVLRKGSEIYAQKFYDYFYQNTYSYQTKFEVIMIIAIIIIVLSGILILPIIFNIYQSNNKVLSLFGIIPTKEIVKLIEKCQEFKKNFMGNNNDKKDDRSSQISKPYSLDNDVDLIIDNEDDMPLIDQSKQKKSQKSDQPVVSFNDNVKEIQIPKKKFLNEKKLLEQNEQEEMLQQQRQDKLMASNSSSQNMILYQFMILGLLFIAYFAQEFAQEFVFFNNFRMVYNHFHEIQLRPSLSKYIYVFTYEEISLDQIIEENGVELWPFFSNQIYTNEKLIIETSKQEFPLQFQNYRDNFININLKSICQFSDIGVQNHQSCLSASNGTLDKGLKASVVGLLEFTRKQMSLFRQMPDNVNSSIQIINSEDYKIIEKQIQFIIQSMEQLNNIFLDNIANYVSSYINEQVIFFSIFASVLVIVLVLLWIPFLQSQNKKIWRTKGMLNMIPLDLITRYPNLKEHFISGEILQAVQ